MDYFHCSATRDQLAEEGLFDIPGITEYRPELATNAQVERVHFCLPSTGAVVTDSHRASAGGAITAARLVMEKKEDKAFALVRPPGHHAMRVTHGNRGFCNINNEAVMVEYIRDHYPHPTGRPLRIAIVDTDVHHGDGSQDIFWNDPNTLFISLHQDGRTLYPGTGFPQECGGPGALGRTINIPLPPETSDEGYLYAIEHAVLPMLADFKPDLVINSAGQDNHFTDPLANMKLSAQGYAALNRALNPDIAVLEGGYAIRGALPYVNLGICLALAGLDAGDIREPQWRPESTRQKQKISDYIARLCDGLLELPIATLLPGIPDDVTPDSTSYLVEWRNFSEDGGIRTVLFALMNPRENYWFQVPGWMRDRISASNNAAQRTTTYTQVVDSLEGDDQLLGAPLFSIRVFPRPVWESRGQSSGYEILAIQGDLVYGIQPLTQDEEGQRIIQEVTDNFQLISES